GCGNQSRVRQSRSVTGEDCCSRESPEAGFEPLLKRPHVGGVFFERSHGRAYSRSETDNAHDILSSCPAPLLLATATDLGFQSIKPICQHQRPNTFRAADLMRRDCQKITTQSIDI